MIRLLLIYVCFFAVAFVAAPAVAVDDSPPVFLSAMPDVPVMQGLRELPEHGVMFDKPGGRIIESVAQVDSGSWAQIQSYYREALPQLGWSILSDDIYVRGDESLHLEFEEIDADNFVRITIAPR